MTFTYYVLTHRRIRFSRRKLFRNDIISVECVPGVLMHRTALAKELRLGLHLAAAALAAARRLAAVVREVLVVVVVHLDAAVSPTRTDGSDGDGPLSCRLHQLLAVAVVVGRRCGPAQLLWRIVEAGAVTDAVTVVIVQIELVPIVGTVEAAGAAERWATTAVLVELGVLPEATERVRSAEEGGPVGVVVAVRAVVI